MFWDLLQKLQALFRYSWEARIAWQQKLVFRQVTLFFDVKNNRFFKMSNHTLYLLYITEHNGQFYLEGINLVVCYVRVTDMDMNRVVSVPKGLHLLTTPGFHLTIYILATTRYLKRSCLKLEGIRGKRNTMYM